MPEIYKVVDLTDAQKDIIKACVPILQSSGEALTTKFYQNMFHDFPETQVFFNKSNQVSARQPKILAFALLKYAENIDDLTPLVSFVKKIVVKHVGLQVKAEHYPCVGSSLIKTMKELLGDLATEEFIGAWTQAYGNLAQLLINLEAEQYSQQAWDGFKPFKVDKIVDECKDVKSIYFSPIDKILAPALPGQYVCIRFKLPNEEHEESRTYSLSQIANNNQYRISVKHLPNGSVSGFIHTQLKVDDIIQVAPPAGEFIYDSPATSPLKFIVGGIGITPIIPMLEKSLSTGQSSTLYYCNRSQERPFVEVLNNFKTKYPHFKVVEYISDSDSVSNPIDEIIYSKITPADIDSINANDDVYLLGPVPFMSDLRAHLNTKSIEPKSEFFGPVVV